MTKKGKIIVTVIAAATGVGLGKWSCEQHIGEKIQTKRKVLELDRKIKKYEKKDEIEKSGKKEIYAEILSSEPMILKCKDSSAIFYYWVKNPEKMGCWITTATGWIKMTGEYKNYQGEVCAVVEAVPVISYTSTIQALKEKRDRCNNL